MRKPECCAEYRDGNFNYCPMCGMAVKSGSRESVPPVISTDHNGIRDSEERQTHLAYGQISFSRRTGSGGGESTLYGSTIQHQHTIAMQVTRSDKYVDEFSERYFGGGRPLIEVEMSQSQFTEAITAMNMGSGVPVTIRSVMGKVMPQCEELTLRQKADKSLDSRFGSLASKLSKAMERIDELTTKKGTLKAGEKDEIRKLYQSFTMEIRSNLPFLKTCIDETVDSSIMQAKDEIEGYYLNKITSLGIEKLTEMVEEGKTKLIT